LISLLKREHGKGRWEDALISHAILF